MKLAPDAGRLDEYACRPYAKRQARSRRRAHALLAANEDVPIAAAATGEVVEGDVNRRRPTEQLRVSLANRRPTAPYAADRIVHARRIAVRPIRGQRIEISGVESAVELDERVQRATVFRPRLRSGDFADRSVVHHLPRRQRKR